MDKVWTWLHAKDWRTWVGHGVQGFLITGIGGWTALGLGAGIYANVVHFGLREAPGIAIAAKNGQTAKLTDGIFDLLAPVAGMALWAVFFGG